MLRVRSSKWWNRLPVEVILAAAWMLVPTALSGQTAHLIPRRDYQAWTSVDFTHPLSDRIDLLLSTGFRYSNDQGRLSYRRITTGFAFQWHRFFTFEPYYQYSVSDRFSGRLRHENRLAFATIVGAPWKRWFISDRNLGERRFRENLRSWRYRNRVEFRRPVALARKKLCVFAWDEVYYSSQTRTWYKNRFALGAGRSLGRKVSLDIFYVHQNNEYYNPSDLNGLGLTIRSRF